MAHDTDWWTVLFQTVFPLVFLQAELWEYTLKFLIPKRWCWLNPNLAYLRTTKGWEKYPWRTFWYLSSAHVQAFFFPFNLCNLQKQLQQKYVAHHAKLLWLVWCWSNKTHFSEVDYDSLSPILAGQWFYRQNCFSFLWILVGRLQALKCFLNSSH